MRSILFVCTGNTCRSPLAAALARLEAKRRNMDVTISSAGTFALEGSPASAHAIGYPVIRIRYLAVLFGGGMAGLGGAYLALVYTPLWVEEMTSGRGWIALAWEAFDSIVQTRPAATAIANWVTPRPQCSAMDRDVQG